MHRLINFDLYRYGGLTSIQKGMSKPGFKYMYYFRKASHYKRKTLFGYYYRFRLKQLSFKYGFQIPVGTRIGKGFYIGHFGTIVINKDVKIGDFCNIAHSTTIGQVSKGKIKGCPTIGDRVWIGTGSVIVGKVTIGSDVLIAPNSFVNFDVPENSLVIGNPTKIIKKNKPTSGYINFTC